MKLVLVVVLLGACVADSEPEDRPVIVEDDRIAEDELCALAAELPASDACSSMCDPDAFGDRLRASGMEGGACYQVRCDLSAETSVTVGICLL